MQSSIFTKFPLTASTQNSHNRMHVYTYMCIITQKTEHLSFNHSCDKVSIDLRSISALFHNLQDSRGLQRDGLRSLVDM